MKHNFELDAYDVILLKRILPNTITVEKERLRQALLAGDTCGADIIQFDINKLIAILKLLENSVAIDK